MEQGIVLLGRDSFTSGQESVLHVQGEEAGVVELSLRYRPWGAGLSDPHRQACGLSSATSCTQPRLFGGFDAFGPVGALRIDTDETVRWFWVGQVKTIKG
jgi:hypothetical protein